MEENTDKLKKQNETSPEELLAGGKIIAVAEPKKETTVESAPEVKVDASSDQPDVEVAEEPTIREDYILRRSERVHVTLPGVSAATAANYGVVFMALRPCFVRDVYEFHTTAGSDGSAVTLNIEKLTGTQAPDAGSTVLSTAFNLKGTANTQQQGALVASRVTRTLSKGDRLCLKDVGTLTAVAGVLVVIEVEYIS